MLVVICLLACILLSTPEPGRKVQEDTNFGSDIDTDKLELPKKNSPESQWLPVRTSDWSVNAYSGSV